MRVLGQMRQATTGEVRLHERKAARLGASAQSTGGFDRLLRTRVRDLPLPKTPEGAIMATNDPESGEYRLTPVFTESSKAMISIH
jgi:hypothetical protein